MDHKDPARRYGISVQPVGIDNIAIHNLHADIEKLLDIDAGRIYPWRERLAASTRKVKRKG
jgi:hypothetical protein